MSKLLSKQLLTFSILFFVGPFGLFSRSLAPNKLLIDTVLSVIDTVRAREIYENKLPSILTEQTELKDKYSVCQELIRTKKKKVGSNAELQLLQKAYEYARWKNPELRKYKTKNPISLTEIIPIAGPIITEAINSGRHGQTIEVYDKNVKKGKLTSDVKLDLSIYADHLRRKIEDLENSMNSNWLSFVPNPPKRVVTTQTKNPNYRGYHYNAYHTLNQIEKGRLMKDYEFLLVDEGELVEESYPERVTYKRYANLPNLRVIDHSFDKHWYAIYNNRGQLVYIPILQRESDEDVIPKSVTDEIRRLIYYQDYQNNKYDILSESPKTKSYLAMLIGRPQGLSKSQIERNELREEGLLRGYGRAFLGTNTNAEAERRMREISLKLDKYTDEVGERYLRQLKKDHADDFGYVYAIERVGDTKFLIVYLNKNTLLPSVCGIVTFFTGNEPYTTDFSVQLGEIPNDIPPVILKENNKN